MKVCPLTLDGSANLFTQETCVAADLLAGTSLPNSNFPRDLVLPFVHFFQDFRFSLC